VVTSQAMEIRNMTIGLVILACVIVVIVGIFITAGIENNMKRISRKFGDVAQGDLTAGEIAAHFDMTKPSVSHHLNILRSAALITDERRGQNIVYSVNLTVFQELMKWFYDCGLVKGDDSNEKE